MPLYIRDDAANALADQLAALTGQSKTEAVKRALAEKIDSIERPRPLAQRIRDVQERITAACAAERIDVGAEGRAKPGGDL